jgi:serine protease Do
MTRSRQLLRRITIGVLCTADLTVIPPSVTAQTSEVSTPAPAETPLPTLPEVFLKPAPAGIDDLRLMESHLRGLVEQLTACTVGIQIGPAQGSGVIVSEDGYVLTAAHVSGLPGRKVDIILPDGHKTPGTTLGRDQTLDAGVIKIDDAATKWPHTEMADWSTVKAGHWCIATGHPGGFQDDRKPVFRLGRVIFASRRIVQTDCELVGGDSGGPLFDVSGKVIGINSRIGEETDKNFHVPISAYTDSWDRLAASESFRTHSGALLGLTGKPHDRGLEITSVYPDDPAAKAGVKVGDILVTFAARPVKDIDQLYDLVGRQRPGRRVTLELLRDNAEVEVEVRLGIRWD